MTIRHTEGKIRDFEMTMEDAERLARCFNSFDDPESWPQGFTRGNPFTGERVLDDLSKRKKIRTIVAHSDDKIVGYCDVINAELDDEACYVGLLGADPTYQGQGYGKALLIEAAETAARHGKRRQDLHTWGGNLKAMPLYKRVGMFWVPGTRVLMESHIPGIIGCELFGEFFERHYWYDAYKPNVTQEMDDVVEDGVGVFNHRFEGDNGDSLDVAIDREAKGITSFSLTLDGKTISASVKPERHLGFIGIDAVPVAFNLKNDTDTELSYSLEIKPTENTTVDFDAEQSGNLLPGESRNLDGTYSVDFGAVSVDREMNPDEKVLTQAEWLLTIEGKTIALYSGIIPREPITLSSGPAYPSVSPGETKTIGIGIRNNTDERVEGSLLIGTPHEFNGDSRDIPFKLDSNQESELDLEITGSATSSTVNKVVTVMLSIGSKLIFVNERILSVGVIGPAGAYAHRSLDNHYVVENESLRLMIKDTPPHVVRIIENKTLGEYYAGWALLPYLGYPFPSGGNEWERKRFDVRLVNETDFAAIELEAESTERPGVVFTITYKVYPGRDYIEIAAGLKNSGTTVYDNLGVRAGGWLNYMASSLYVPVRGDIYRLESPEWSGSGRQLSKKPEYFHESWCASKSSSGRLLGYIWDSDDLVEVHPRRQYGIPVVEYKLPDLKPGDSTTKTILRVIVNQSEWSEVRALWSRISGRPIDSVDPPSLRSDLEAEIVPVSFEGIRKGLSPVLVDRSRTNKFELRIRVIHDTTISGSVTVRMPEGVLVNGKSDLYIDIEEISIDKPFTLPIDISSKEGEGWFRKNGELEIRFPSRIEIRPFAAVLYDSTHKTNRSVEDFGNMNLHTLESGGVQIAASAEYVGSLVRFGYSGEASLLRDTFPEAGPFMWWDKDYTGLHPIVMGRGVWDWMTGYQKESWTIRDSEEGPWVGFELESKIQFCPGLKGMTIRTKFLMLPGVPIAYAAAEAMNSSGTTKRLRFGFRGIPRINGKQQSRIHTMTDDRAISYYPTENEAEIAIQAEAGWGAFEEPESQRLLGVVSQQRSEENVYLENMGANAQIIVMRIIRDLRPGESSTFTSYLLVPQGVEDMPLLTGLSDSPE